MKIEDY